MAIYFDLFSSGCSRRDRRRTRCAGGGFCISSGRPATADESAVSGSLAENNDGAGIGNSSAEARAETCHAHVCFLARAPIHCETITIGGASGEDFGVNLIEDRVTRRVSDQLARFGFGRIEFFQGLAAHRMDVRAFLATSVSGWPGTACEGE